MISYHNQITVAGKWVDCKKAVPREPIVREPEELDPNYTLEDGEKVEETAVDQGMRVPMREPESKVTETSGKVLLEKNGKENCTPKTNFSEGGWASPDWESVFKERKQNNTYSSDKNSMEGSKENRLQSLTDCEETSRNCFQSWYEPRKVKLDPRRWQMNKPPMSAALVSNEGVKGHKAKEQMVSRLY